MKRKKLNPHSPEVINAAVEMIRQMTPEEKLAFLNYRTPGVPMTDMTGIFGDCEEPKLPAQARHDPAPDEGVSDSEEVALKRKKRLNPNSKEVVDAAVERIRKMTPEEAIAFLTYRTPGVEMTDMTGMFGGLDEYGRPLPSKRDPAPD